MTKNEMIAENVGLVYGLAHKYYKTNTAYTFDDLVQVGMLAICEKIDRFDESRGGLSTFLTHCIRNEMFKYMGVQSRQSRAVCVDPSKLSIKKDHKIMFFEEEYLNKNTTENKIIKMMYEGHDIKSISEHMGIPKKTLYRRINKIRKRIRENEKEKSPISN